MRRRQRAPLFPAFPRQLSRAMYGVLRRSGAAHWRRRSGAVVFCYHNVVPDRLAGQVGDGWLHIGFSEFAEQIAWIAKAHTVVPMSELITRHRKGRPLGGLAVLTFDDGYVGCIRHAIPLLRDTKLPFAIFPVVSTAAEPKPFWWDHLGPIDPGDRIRFLGPLQGDADLIDTPTADVPYDAMPASWDMLRTVRGADCEFGVHTMTHRNLASLAREEIAWELAEARSRLTEELGVVQPVAAYPYGGMNAVVQAEMQSEGFQAGFSLEFGLVRSGAEPFNLSRVSVPAGIGMSSFACWGSGLKLR
jgi:peptidoglycan/xylan/chitin deacetylase (PgdA/CDA1 family)